MRGSTTNLKDLGSLFSSNVFSQVHTRAIFLHLDVSPQLATSWNLPEQSSLCSGICVECKTNSQWNLLITNKEGFSTGVLRNSATSIVWSRSVWERQSFSYSYPNMCSRKEIFWSNLISNMFMIQSKIQASLRGWRDLLLGRSPSSWSNEEMLSQSLRQWCFSVVCEESTNSGTPRRIIHKSESL